jgi:hypothetical protein
MNIRTMRSSTVNLEPLGLEEGELAVNVGDTPPVLYVGDGVSSLRVGPVVIDTTAPTNPKPGTIWADNTTGVRKIWLFSAWRELNSTTLHNPALNYAVGDTVVAEGALWSAPAPIAAGAFNNAEWTSEVGGAASSAFPAGTKMLFNQSSAPTGWTKDVVHNDKALRVVSGVAGDGGSVPFTSAFIGGNTGATALTVAQLPSHAHTMSGSTNSAGAHSHTIASGEIGEGGNLLNDTREMNTVENNYPTSTAGSHSHSISASISSTGSGATHTHSLNLAVQYTDVIIATKDA